MLCIPFLRPKQIVCFHKIYFNVFSHLLAYNFKFYILFIMAFLTKHLCFGMMLPPC